MLDKQFIHIYIIGISDSLNWTCPKKKRWSKLITTINNWVLMNWRTSGIFKYKNFWFFFYLLSQQPLDMGKFRFMHRFFINIKWILYVSLRLHCFHQMMSQLKGDYLNVSLRGVWKTMRSWHCWNILRIKNSCIISLFND